MTGTVFDVSDLSGVTGPISAGAQLIEQGAHRFHNLNVGLFVPATHVVGFAQAAAFQHTSNGTAVVFDIQPIAHLHAITIHRQRLARQRIDNHERNELFRKVQRAIVVAAIGGDHRQAIRVVPCTHQMIAGGFAGTVGAVGLVLMVFCECRVLRGKAAIHLIG